MILGKRFQGNWDFPDSLAELFLNGFLLILLDYFGMSNVLRQTRIFIAQFLQAVSPLTRVASDCFT